jgi:hypothetical protein
MMKIVQVLAELEAKTIGARVTASNRVLRASGRRTGGKVCFGFENVKNPAGEGFVLAVREDQATYVREAVNRVVAGESVLAVARDFTDRGQPFHANSLAKLLRRPTLYGATPVRGDVVRREGEPVLGAAIIDRETWDSLQDVLDGRVRPGDRRVRNLALLHGIVRCSGCGGALSAQRSKVRKYSCLSETCTARVGINMDLLEEHVVADALATYGDDQVIIVERVGGVDRAALAAVEQQMDDRSQAMKDADDDEYDVLQAEHRALRRKRAELVGQTAPRLVRRPAGITVRQAYAAAESVADRRGILGGVVAVTIAKGQRGGVKVAFDPARVTIAAAA